MAAFIMAGAGGHAKVAIATLEAAGHQVVRVLDDDAATHGTHILGHRVDGAITEALIPNGALVIIGIGSNRARQAIASRLRASFGIAVHPTAIVHESVKIGAGSVVFAGAIVQPGTVIGEHVIVNTAATLDHDCVVGDFGHLAPGVRLAGDVRLSEGAFMGVGSCAIPGARLGAWTVIGAGAVVLGEVAAGAVAVGVPARPRTERP